MPPNEDGPWNEIWEWVEDLSGGGQGSTYIVANKTDGDKAVLKVLKSNDSKNRRRMYREVTNLKILHGAKCNVPLVLEDNTRRFNEIEEAPHLYFVMEKIEGKTLTDFVKSNGSLELDLAVKISLALCDTVEGAFLEQVLHRDIKPDNIVVRSVDDGDVVMLDYGLSFNAANPGDETDSAEPIGNAFFRKPEQTATGGSKREEQSDLADIVAIFYYCLTAKYPGSPADGNGVAPHRREGIDLKPIVNSDAQARRLETFFDKGFQPLVDMRFQTPEELRNRLMYFLGMASVQPMVDPVEVARRITEFHLQHDWPTRRKVYKKTAGRIISDLQQTFQQINLKINTEVKGHPLAFVLLNAGASLENLKDAEYLEGIVIRIELAAHPPNILRGLAYQVAARGSECVLFCGDVVLDEKARVRVEAGIWTEIFSCDGMTELADSSEASEHMNRYIYDRIEELLRQSHQL